MKFAIFFLFLFINMPSAVAGDWDWEDFKKEIATPYTTSARNVLIAGTPVTAGFAISEDWRSIPRQAGS